ncbi:MAG: metal ABC transporter substrate-binding protein [Eubacteriales bacterium]|nr:metal ABC transporter substrate-binding protein [Eubacteriales bacterium]
MMKRLLTIAVILLFIIPLCACDVPKPVRWQGEGIKVITTIFPAYDFVRAIKGDSENLKMLIKPGSEVHSYEPTPQDIELINTCDVFIYVGGESDSWIDSILHSMNNPDMKVFKMMDYVDNLPEEHMVGMQIREGSHNEDVHDEKETHLDHEEYDEHIWTSPTNAIKIVRGIADILCEVDTDNKQIYSENSNRHIIQLNELDMEFKKIVANGRRNTFVFGDRFPLLHFAKEYGINYYAAYPGCSAESEPNAGTLAFLIEKVKDEEIPVVFHIELSNQKMVDTICEETGAKKMLFSSCHNLTAKQFEAGVTYIDMMKGNVKALEQALN